MIICTVVGCGPSTAEIMNSWNGSHISEVIRSWGPPQQVTSDGASGRIYIWSKYINIPIGQARQTTTGALIPDGFGGYYINSRTIYTPQTVIQADYARMFWVNTHGFVYHWQAEGFIVEKVEAKKLLITIGVSTGVALLIVGLAWTVEEMQ